MMDTLAFLEAKKTIDRHQRAQDRLITNQGPEVTDAGIGITQAYIGRLRDAVVAKLGTKSARSNSPLRGFEAILRQLDQPERVALVILQAALRHIGGDDGALTPTAMAMVTGLEQELWVAKVTKDNPKVAARLETRIRKRHSRVGRRQQAFKAEAARLGYNQTEWSEELRARAGAWMMEVLLAALPEVFGVVEQKRKNFLVLTPAAEAMALELVEDLILRRPVFLPSDEPPVPWTGWASGGPRDQRSAYARTLLRSRHKDRAAAVKGAIKEGQAQPALDAINALQATPWRINTRILDVIQACVDRGIEVKGLPGKNLAAPVRLDDADEGQEALWRLKRDRVRNHNSALVGDRIMLTEDLGTAERMRDWPAFWTPMSLDWRGRVYGMTIFNFQRDDRVRALFQFAEGEPITEDGIWWLKVHVANCGAFEKIDKRPLTERVSWVDENCALIQAVAADPMACPSFWTAADKPFLFLAAALELSAALAVGPHFITTLPVSFDGSCSGLQHLCAMTRAPEGSLVNLTPAPLPQDVYATVAKRVLERVTADSVAEPEEGKEWVPTVAKLWLEHGIDRKVVKRNVMTYSYSSKRFGMAQQQQTDLMDVLDEEVLTGKLEEHPFGPYSESTAAKYIAGHVYAGIEEIINLPAQAMGFLQKLAKALAHEGKPLRWTTPVGLPWINRYHVMASREIRLWMSDRGVLASLSIQTEQPAIDKDRSASGVAPNFVHALDAAHLMLVANAAAKEGISIATVHDSFGCLASRARRFNAIIREQFVAMYETHDVLAEVLAQAKHDLTPHNWQRLPEVPHQGTLELKGVLNADYAFA